MNSSAVITKAKSAGTYLWDHREIVLLMVCAFLVYLLLHKKPAEIIIKDTPLTLQKLDSIRDRNGQLYAIVQQSVIEKATAKAIIDSLSQALKIKPKTIQGVTQFITRDSIVYTDTGSTKLVITSKKDTAYSTEFHDKWVNIRAVAGKDTGHIDYSSKDSLWTVAVVKSHLFGPDESMLYIHSANPHTRITDGASFKQREKRTWFVVDLQVGYNPFTQKPYIGIGGGFPIIQIKK